MKSSPIGLSLIEICPFFCAFLNFRTFSQTMILVPHKASARFYARSLFTSSENAGLPARTDKEILKTLSVGDPRYFLLRTESDSLESSCNWFEYDGRQASQDTFD